MQQICAKSIELRPIVVGRVGKIEIRAILIEFRASLYPKFEANVCKVDRISTNCGRPRGEDRILSNFERVQKARIEPERESEHDFETEIVPKRVQ